MPGILRTAAEELRSLARDAPPYSTKVRNPFEAALRTAMAFPGQFLEDHPSLASAIDFDPMEAAVRALPKAYNKADEFLFPGSQNDDARSLVASGRYPLVDVDLRTEPRLFASEVGGVEPREDAMAMTGTPAAKALSPVPPQQAPLSGDALLARQAQSRAALASGPKGLSGGVIDHAPESDTSGNYLAIMARDNRNRAIDDVNTMALKQSTDKEVREKQRAAQDLILHNAAEDRERRLRQEDESRQRALTMEAERADRASRQAKMEAEFFQRTGNLYSPQVAAVEQQAAIKRAAVTEQEVQYAKIAAWQEQREIELEQLKAKLDPQKYAEEAVKIKAEADEYRSIARNRMLTLTGSLRATQKLDDNEPEY